MVQSTLLGALERMVVCGRHAWWRRGRGPEAGQMVRSVLLGALERGVQGPVSCGGSRGRLIVVTGILVSLMETSS